MSEEEDNFIDLSEKLTNDIESNEHECIIDDEYGSFIEYDNDDTEEYRKHLDHACKTVSLAIAGMFLCCVWTCGVVSLLQI